MCVWFEHSSNPKWFDWYVSPIREPVAPDAENRIPVFDLRAFWPTMTRLYIAHWLIAVVAAALGIAPWIPRRISLRGLMVALTAIGIVGGLIRWIDRTF